MIYAKAKKGLGRDHVIYSNELVTCSYAVANKRAGQVTNVEWICRHDYFGMETKNAHTALPWNAKGCPQI